MADTKRALIDSLQKNILQWEGYKPPELGERKSFGLNTIEANFPNGVFPISAIHEMVCDNTEQATASSGFICGLLSVLMQNGGACMWISLSGTMYPVALKSFELEPDRIIFIHIKKDKDVLWVMEEALKCAGLTAVVGELSEFDFKQSRRLQLAVERSGVTGFILRNRSNKMGSTACAARWHIKSFASQAIEGLPGLGFPRWQVELSRVRNGKPGNWIIEWSDSGFTPIVKEQSQHLLQKFG